MTHARRNGKAAPLAGGTAFGTTLKTIGDRNRSVLAATLQASAAPLPSCREALAQRFARRYGGEVWYVQDWRTWIVRDGGDWVVDRCLKVHRLVQAVATEGADCRAAIGNRPSLGHIERRAAQLLELPVDFALELLPRRCAFYANKRIRRTLPPAIRPPASFHGRQAWWNRRA